MVIISPTIDISLIAVAVVVISKIMQAKFIDKKKQKESQARMKEKQKKIKELMHKEDEKSKNEMDTLQKELLEEMNETMQGTMRYMMFSLPLFLGAFFVMGTLFGIEMFETPFLVPKFEGFFMFNPFTWMPVGWVGQTGWLKWYFIVYLITSITIGIVMKIKEKFIVKE